MNSVLKSAYKHTRNKFCKQRKNIVNIFLTSSQSKSAGFLIFFKKKVTDDAKKKVFQTTVPLLQEWSMESEIDPVYPVTYIYI